MVFFNYTTMQMTAKVVYYGPGLCGKTTNLQFIHQKTAPKSRGEMVSLETETDRTLFFDLLPLEVGVIGGMKVRLQLYTVPGQVFYNATRKLVLKGVDGIVFVADSQRAALDTNLESLGNLNENLRELGSEPVPLVLQYNKRDLRGVISVDELNASLNTAGHPFFEAAALHGIGVFETLKGISKLAINSVRQKLGTPEPRRGVGSPFAATPAAVAVPPAQAAPAAKVTTAAPAAALSEIESLVSAGGARADEVPVEFAEEDTGTHDVRAVRTQALGDIHAELEKLRAIAAAAATSAAKPVAAPRRTDIDRRLQEMLTPEGAARQDLKRKASLEVPSEVLKSAVSLRVQVAFTSEAGETIQEAVVVPLGANARLERVALHLDLDIKSKA